MPGSREYVVRTPDVVQTKNDVEGVGVVAALSCDRGLFGALPPMTVCLACW